MEIDEWKTFVNRIIGLYPTARKQFKDSKGAATELQILWYRRLKNYSYQECRGAIEKLRAKSNTIPPVKKVQELCKKPPEEDSKEERERKEKEHLEKVKEEEIKLEEKLKGLSTEAMEQMKEAILERNPDEYRVIKNFSATGNFWKRIISREML